MTTNRCRRRLLLALCGRPLARRALPALDPDRGLDRGLSGALDGRLEVELRALKPPPPRGEASDPHAAFCVGARLLLP